LPITLFGSSLRRLRTDRVVLWLHTCDYLTACKAVRLLTLRHRQDPEDGHTLICQAYGRCPDPELVDMCAAPPFGTAV
jgi:hypothetical protein